MTASSELEFVPIEVLANLEDRESAPAAKSVAAAGTSLASGHAPVPRPAMDERPGVIEIDLACGTRLRVDALVNERALRRVLAVLRPGS